MDNILISVIIPAYNIEKYISRCLDSLLEQTHKKLEIIVVDDGSEDDTGKIIDKYALIDSRIVSVHKKNGGVSSARLNGIEKATGEYIGFVDGDDYIEPEMYRQLLRNALNYKAQISHCGYKMIFPNGRIDEYYGRGIIKRQNHKEAIIDLIRGDFVEPGLWNKLYHNTLFKGLTEEKSWDATIRLNEDLLMNYLLFKKANNSVYEDKTYYHYVLRKGSAATSKTQRYKITDPLKVIELIKADIDYSDEVYSVIYCRYLRCLISIITQYEWDEAAIMSKNKLKIEVFKRDFWRNCKSVKLRLMVICIVYVKSIYMLIREFYENVSGIKTKYEV